MRVVVIDACVALKWFVREEDSGSAVQLLEEEDPLFIAPDIFRPEIVNGLLKQRRMNQLSDDLLDRALVEAELTMPQLVPSSSLVERATMIARSLNHPLYDCLYLSLAERWNTQFIMADERFAKRCRAGLPDEPITPRLRLLREFYQT